MSPKPIAIGNDEAAAGLRAVLAEHLESLGFSVDLFGPAHSESEVDYPDVAVEVANKVADGNYDRALLLCGTGIGMAIAAFFFQAEGGIRAGHVTGVQTCALPILSLTTLSATMRMSFRLIGKLRMVALSSS